MNPIITQLSFQEQEVLWRCSGACETLPICVYLTYVVIAAYNHSKAWGAKSSCLLLRQRSFGAMSFELELNTVQGGVITLDVFMTDTVRELKSMLLEKHPCQDPIERKILKVELLHNSSIIDEAEALNSARFLGDEFLVTVVYRRNEVEAATQHDIRTQGCVALKIPSNVTSISEAAFQNSRQLVLLTIPESVNHIGNYAFQRCTSLASITLGESVTHIGDRAFEFCTSLASITLGDSVAHIGYGAFEFCTSLANITLGESVTHIGDYAFEGCTSLASIVLGESVTHIGDHAFQRCTSLASITLGESVTHIGNSAFLGCSSLASITLGESVTYVGTLAFGGCTSLVSITMPESVADMSDYFVDSSVAITIIPARKRRKRRRNEWVSVQICYDPVVWPAQPAQTCHDESDSLPHACCKELESLQPEKSRNVKHLPKQNEEFLLPEIGTFWKGHEISSNYQFSGDVLVFRGLPGGLAAWRVNKLRASSIRLLWRTSSIRVRHTNADLCQGGSIPSIGSIDDQPPCKSFGRRCTGKYWWIFCIIGPSNIKTLNLCSMGPVPQNSQYSGFVFWLESKNYEQTWTNVTPRALHIAGIHSFSGKCSSDRFSLELTFQIACIDFKKIWSSCPK